MLYPEMLETGERSVAIQEMLRPDVLETGERFAATKEIYSA